MSMFHYAGDAKAWTRQTLDTCLVVKPYASCVVNLQHVSMFHYAGGARAWMMQAPWYLPCGEAAYVMWRCCCCLLKSLNCT